MFDKRITVFMGHYGSGKTFVSVNYALALAKLGKKVSIYDLDIVNPYFRTVDAKKSDNTNLQNFFINFSFNIFFCLCRRICFNL